MNVLPFALLTALNLLAQDPFKPLDLDRASGVQPGPGLREDWMRTTNRGFELAGKTRRVALEGADRSIAVVLDAGVTKARHAKPILLGKDEHAVLFRSLLGLGFSRIVVRNPNSAEQWGARLEGNKAVLEF